MPFYRIPVHITVAALSPEQAVTSLLEYLRIYWHDEDKGETFAEYGEAFAKNLDIKARVLAHALQKGMPVGTDILAGEVTEMPLDVLFSFIAKQD